MSLFNIVNLVKIFVVNESLSDVKMYYVMLEKSLFETLHHVLSMKCLDDKLFLVYGVSFTYLTFPMILK